MIINELKEPNVPGHLSPPQFNFLYQIVLQATPRTAVEIGTYMGRSSYAISKALHDLRGQRKLICVDSWKQKLDPSYFASDHITHLFKMFPSVRSIYVRPGEIKSMIELFHITMERYPFMKEIIEIRNIDSRKVDLSNDSIDFSFIDADHTYEGVKNDISKILEGARPGTVMAFHDYSEKHYPGVVQAIQELRTSRATEWIGQVEFTAALRILE